MSNVTPSAEFQSASLSPCSLECGVEPPHSRDLASELRARWQRGERAGIESLGEAFDAIRDDEEQLLDVLYHEVLIREEFGDEPDVEQFVARFPHIAERLRRQFEVHAAVDQDWRGDGFEPDDPELLDQPQWPTIGADGRTNRLIRLTADISAPPGYELLEELGRGGTAIVFKARQQSLNRLVALKMILGGHFASEQALARFRQEAQAVAQLQHPGIVQIHEVGEHHGLPFLSLEFVPGGTLQQLLNGRPLSDDVAARLVESLARTMHVAHERGVIHRDLKPANVLLTSNPKRERALQEPTNSGERGGVSPPVIAPLDRGADAAPLAGAEIHAGGLGPESHDFETSSFGASSLADASGYLGPSLADASGYLAQQTLPLDESLLSTPKSPLPTPKISDFGLARLLNGGSELTTTGQVIGTPSYMAPEQAGESKLSAGPAPDIYSLGAILYETLTGRPPFQAATILQTLEQVRDQEPVPPRQLQPRLPVELETICLKCLEKSPSRRYATALELADDLTRFLNHEPIAARRSNVIERSRKWIHRRPAVAALLSALVVLTVVGWTMILREAQRANTNEASVRRERDEAQKARATAESERQNAREAQARAEANFLKATEVVSRFSELGMQLQNEARQQETSSRLFDAALQFYENVLVERGDDPAVRFQAASAFLRAAEIREVLSKQDVSIALIDRAIELLDGLVAENTAISHRRTLSNALRVRASNARHRAELKKAGPAYDRAIELMNSVVRDNPNDLNDQIQRGMIHVAYGVMLKGADRHDESLRHHQLAEEIFRAAVARWPNEDVCQLELANALNSHANTLWYVQRHDEATPLYRESFELSRTLHQHSPSHVNTRVLYARHLTSLTRIDQRAGDLDLAAERLDEAARVLNDVVTNYPDNINYLSELLWKWTERVSLEQRRGNTAMFDRACRMELSLLGNLMRRVPLTSRYDERFALASYRFADWLWVQDQKSESRDHYEVALQVLKQVATRLPDEATTQHQLAWSHVVCPFPDLRDVPLAETAAAHAVELAPDNVQSWLALGAVQLRSNQPAAAVTSLQKALTLNPDYDRERAALIHAQLSLAQFHQSHPAEARASLAHAALQVANPLPQLARLLNESEREVTSPDKTPPR